MTDKVHNIAEPLIEYAVPIDSLNLDPNNAREHGEHDLGELCKMLTRFSQVQPIVVRKDTMTVSAGNGRLLAAKKLGWTHIAAVVVDQSEADAMAYAIADNRSAELSRWNYPRLGEQLQQLRDANKELLEFIGYTEKQGAEIIAMLDKANADVEIDTTHTPGDESDPSGGDGGAWKSFTCLMSRDQIDEIKPMIVEMEKSDLARGDGHPIGNLVHLAILELYETRDDGPDGTGNPEE